jgi:hypothetical protein
VPLSTAGARAAKPKAIATARECARDIHFNSDHGGTHMPLINYSEPMTFCDTVEAAAIILQACLTRLRDEAQFRDDGDTAPLAAAHLLLNMLEDALKDAGPLTNELERRISGKTRHMN